VAKLVSPSSVIDAITQEFGPQTPNWYSGFGYAGHMGLDFGFQQSEIRACDAGSVTVAGFDAGGYGTWVEISHPWGKSRYAHGIRGSLKVRGGDLVKASQPLFDGDSTGNSTGPHLHFEIRMPASPELHTPGMKTCVDPLPYLPVKIGGQGREIGEAHVEDEISRLQQQIGILTKDGARNRELKGKFEWAVQELLNIQLSLSDQLNPSQQAIVETVRVEVEKARGNL
jgi:hypothetical protein